MAGTELELAFDSAETFRREYEENLRHGRAFVPGARGLELFASCTLRVVRADLGAAEGLEARVVMVSDREPMRGIAVELVGEAWRDRLEELSKREPSAQAPAHDEDVEPQVEDTTDSADAEADVTEKNEPRALERHRQMRALSPAERIKVAQGLKLEDRVLLERIYGSVVWDLLLRSPHTTIPEVARIARKGTLPRPLAEVITDNANWIRQDIVRRALLSNPRVTPEGITKILRATPARELKLVANQTAYPMAVRTIARKLMGGG